MDSKVRHSNVVVCDTETGGLDHRKHALIEVALVAYDGHGPEPLNLITHPQYQEGKVCTPEALAVNGFTQEIFDASGIYDDAMRDAIASWFTEFCHLRGLIKQVDYSGELSDATADFRKIVLAGHNISFDRFFLKEFLGREMWSHRTLDTHTLLWAAHQRGDLIDPKMDAAFEELGIVVSEGQRHRALGDAMATKKLLKALVDLPRNNWDRLRLFRDGAQWCALFGKDLQEGIAGFGDTPDEARADFSAKMADLTRLLVCTREPIDPYVFTILDTTQKVPEMPGIDTPTGGCSD